MSKPNMGWLWCAVLCVGLVGCATTATSIDAQWVNPAVVGKKPVRSMMVMSAQRDATNRRLFEDRMVAVLTTKGVNAVQSYKFIPEDGPVAEEALRKAIGQANVSHAMVTRIINVSTQVNVSPGMVMGPAWGPGWGWGGGWGPGWGGFAGYHNAMWATSIPPQVTTTQNVHADTRVMDATDAAVLWSAATTTATGYNSATQLIDQFVQLIVTALTADGIV